MSVQAAETEAPITAASVKQAADQLVELLKLRTLPIGMKHFSSVEEMMKIPSIRTPTKGKQFSTCQLVTQARIHGFTLGITIDNVRASSNCSAVIGGSATAAIASRCFFASGDCIARVISALSRSTMGRGVPAGA